MDRPENYDALPGPVKRQYDAAIAKQAAMGGESETNEPQEKDDGGQRQGQAEALLGSEAKQEPEAPAVDWRTEYQKQAALNAEMQRRLMMMEAQFQQSQPQGQPQEVARADEINWEGLQDLPDELVEAMRKMYGKLNAVETGQAQVQKQAATLGQQSFAQALEAAVPGWQAKNTDAGWLKWLEQPDPMSGFVRQALLDKAAESLDVGRVASIFNSYFGQAQAAPAKPKRSAGLADLATPGSSRTTVAGEPPKTLSREELSNINSLIARDSKARNDPKIQAIISNLGGSIQVQ